MAYDASSAAIPAVTSETFEARVLREKRPVLVHVIADWAPPCRAQGGVIAALARESDRFAFVTLDAIREEELAAVLQVRALPTLLLYRGGRLIERFVGFQSGLRLRSALTAAATPVTCLRCAA